LGQFGNEILLQMVKALTVLSFEFETYTKRLQGSTVTPEGTVPVAFSETAVIAPVDETE
jgi:hypothetical protein